MNKICVSILFAAGLIFTGCTVHHYHHETGPHGKKMQKHHGASGHHALPPGHPPVKGMKGHGMMPKGHGKKCGMKGCGMMPKGHPPVKGHGMKGHPPMKGHGMKGHGMKGHGMKGHGMKGHGMKGHGMPKGHGSHGMKHDGHHGSPQGSAPHPGQDHKGHDNQPAEVIAFHDVFAAAWHKETDEARRTAACAQIAQWKKLALAVKKLKGGIVLAAATKDLHQKTLAVGFACARKNGDVQAALTTAHDALHMLFKVAEIPAGKAAAPAKAAPAKKGMPAKKAAPAKKAVPAKKP